MSSSSSKCYHFNHGSVQWCCVADSIKSAVERVLLQVDSDSPPCTGLMARKSRSVENILSSSDTTSCTSSVVARRLSSGKLPPPSSCFTCDLPAYRCHEASNAETPRHPGSGLSSAGSHTSLLDSPEIISVSWQCSLQPVVIGRLHVTVWCPLLPYGYSYKASYARPA